MYNLEFGKMHVTEKGNKYLIIENNHPGICLLEISIRRGSVYDSIGKEGTHHFLEHMMFKGTSLIGTEEFNKKMKYYGATHNAYSTFKETSYHVDCITDNIIPVSELLIDSIAQPALLFDENIKTNIVENERKVILEEYNIYKNPNELARSLIDNLLIGDSKDYNTVIGNEDSIKSITYQDLVNAYMRYNKEDILFIINVSKSDNNITDEILNKILENYEDKFEVFQDSCYDIKPKIVKFKSDNTTLEEIKGLSYNIILKAYNIDISEQDVFTLFSSYLVILNQVLLNEIREKHSLVYHISAQPTITDDNNKRLIKITAATEHPKEVLDFINEIVPNLKSYIDEDMFVGALNDIRKNIILSDRLMDENYKLVRYIYNKDFDIDDFLENHKKLTTYERLCSFIDTLDLSDTSTITIGKDSIYNDTATYDEGIVYED